MIAVADAVRIPLADQSVDLVVGSPPYQDARTYGIKADRKIHAWVEWMLAVTYEALRVCRGPVWWVWAGCTRGRCYQPGPEAVAWEWFKEGGHLIHPCVFVRSGIAGSGGTQEFRHDHEYIHGFKRPGPLPYADVKACGHAPKWKNGGTPTHRNINGRRCSNGRRLNGEKRAPGKRSLGRNKDATKHFNGSYCNNPDYELDLVNPGTVIKAIVGGGNMGDSLASRGEAPYPECVPERFIKTYCPVGGTVLDPFSGSGTTAAVCVKTNRRFVVFDIRESQAMLTRKRVNCGLTPELIA